MRSLRTLTANDLSDMNATMSSLGTRLTTAETNIGTLSTSLNAVTARTTTLETWRAAKATASPDVSTSYTSPTSVITLGLNAPTAAGINTIVGTIMGEINNLKAILRTREILAA